MTRTKRSDHIIRSRLGCCLTALNCISQVWILFQLLKSKSENISMERNPYNQNNPQPIQSNPYELTHQNPINAQPPISSNPINQPYPSEPYVQPYNPPPIYNSPPAYGQPPPYAQPVPYSQPGTYGQPTPYSQPAPPIVYQVNVDQGTPCPVCGKNASMMPIKETSTTQWIWCFVLFLVCWPCCWVPCVMDKCNDVRYECSNCRAVRNWYRAPCCP